MAIVGRATSESLMICEEGVWVCLLVAEDWLWCLGDPMMVALILGYWF